MSNYEHELKLKNALIAVYFLGIVKMNNQGTLSPKNRVAIDSMIGPTQVKKYKKLVTKVNNKIEKWYETSIAGREGLIEKDDEFYDDDKSPDVFSSMSSSECD